MINRFITILKKKALHEVSFVYTGALINGLSLFCINIFLGRILEKNLFGVFSLSIMVLSAVAEMSDFGLNGGLLRFAPYYLAQGEESKLKQLVKTIWRWRVWLSAILTFGGIAVSPLLAQYVFNRPEITRQLMFAFLGIGGVVLVGFTSTYLQASQKFLTNSIMQSLKGVLRLALVVVLYLIGVRDVFSYLFIYIFIPWVLFLFSYKYLPPSFRGVQIEEEVKQKMHSQLAKFSFWLTIWSLSAILASKVDQIMLSNLMGLEKVAVYTMAFQFVYVYSLALQSITAVLMPKINALKTNEELWGFAKRIMKWVAPLVLLLILAIYISQFVIGFVFGHKYTESIPVYMFLSYSMLVSFIAIPTSLIITAFNKTQLVAYSGFLQLIINFVLNLVLIPRFGVMGAAYTFGVGLATAFLYNLICSVYLLKKKQIQIV
jgi:O-antigen/teichoic acid export membrane protein